MDQQILDLIRDQLNEFSKEIRYLAKEQSQQKVVIKIVCWVGGAIGTALIGGMFAMLFKTFEITVQ